jgi:hypothetical protein
MDYKLKYEWTMSGIQNYNRNPYELTLFIMWSHSMLAFVTLKSFQVPLSSHSNYETFDFKLRMFFMFDFWIPW